MSVSIVLSQVNYGGQPYMWESIEKRDLGICGKTFDALDAEKLLEEDQNTPLDKTQSFRFGIEHDVEWNNENEGIFKYLDNGDRIWCLPIKCRDAYAMSITFSEFELMPGAKVFIWDQGKKDFIGSFTNQNNKEWGSFATQLLHTDRLVVEVYEPKKTIGKNKYEIGTVVQAYRSILPKYEAIEEDAKRGPFGNSGACNINVNCPEGIDWEEDKTSVALIVSGGFAACTGALVNNTAQDETPYFLTANHCLGGQNNWVFYFNHETAGCTGNTGPTNMSVSGSTLLASSAGSDFALLELAEDIPDSFNVTFAGWDNSDQDVSLAVGIHHPSGDLKKICFEDDAPYHNVNGGAEVWFIDEWELGVTEPGSSGSPLFDQNHRIIGQLFGGAAACNGSVNNGQFDYYGRFGVSWDGTSNSTRLRDHLDPSNSGVTTLDSYSPNAVSFENDGQIQNILNVPNKVCSDEVINPSFTLKNNGTSLLTSANISYSYNGGTPQSLAWSGSLEEDETDIVSLPAMTPEIGLNTIEVSVININGGITDQNSNNNESNKEFLFNAGFISLNLELLTDDFGYETYWEIRNGSGTVVISGGNTSVGINGGGLQVATANDPGAYDNNTIYNETYVVPSDDCYEFELVDDYADGICCGFGEGGYTLSDGSGNVISQGGSFGATELVITGMSVNPLSLNQIENINTSIFPNPAEDQLFIQFDQVIGSIDINLFNQVGQMVLSKKANNRDLEVLDVSEFSNGIYTLKINTEFGTLSKKVVIR